MGLLSNRCPHCQKGRVFSSFFFIRQRCTECDLLFEKEEGYFFGPMIISYFLTLLCALPVLLISVFRKDAQVGQAMVPAAVIVLVVGPVLYRYSKLVWLHLETAFGRKMQDEKDRASKR